MNFLVCQLQIEDAIIHSCFENFLDHNILNYFWIPRLIICPNCIIKIDFHGCFFEVPGGIVCTFMFNLCSDLK
jgi:hypothetical protein